MAPAPTKGLQHTPAPSQFAQFKNTAPLTTASVEPPSTHPRQIDPLLPSLNDPAEPKAINKEARKFRASGLKSKPATTTNGNGNHTNNGNAGHIGTPEPPASPGSQAGHTTMANGNTAPDSDDEDDENDDYYVSQTIIDHLKAFVGHPITHLSNRQIKELIEALPQTQATTLETQEEPPQAIAQPASGVGLAGEDRNGSPPHQGADDPLPPQPQSSASLAPPQSGPSAPSTLH
ncbi:hypothetical protein FS749_003767 [Ceratobasidium sp. UAMH 11750]|nr:hypothetical protein FS749_003767 [Ceratobasidium sp. UAMH 11750]